MTVQQDQSTAAHEAVQVPVVRLPEPRPAGHDDAVPAPPQPPRGWGSLEDRSMGRWFLVMMAVLGLYGALMVTLGTRVW